MVTFSVTDAAGNPGSAQATVTVTDQGSPIVTAPAPLTVAAVDALGTPATAAAIQTFLTGATAVDAVDGDLTASITHDAPAQFPLGVTTVTFSVTDSGTNTGTAQATVTIADQTASVVTAPAPIIVPAVDGTGTPATDAAIVAFLAGATALDNVDGDLTGGITHNAPAQFPLGVTTVVTFSVTDAAGNPGSAQATVTVTDQGSPIVTAPAPLTVAAVDALGTPATAAAIQTFLTGATAVDAVDGDLTASITHDAPAQFPLGVTTVTFSVTDSGTNTGTAQATVTIADQTAPVVTAPAPIIVPAVDGTGTPATDAAIVAFLAGATALDNVDGDLTGGITHNAPGQFPVGVTTVTFSVTDAAGNPGSAQATVTVTDQGSPIVTAPAPLTVAAVDALGTPATAAAIQTFLTGATAVDAVDGDLTASITHDAPAQFPLGVTTVTFSVTDSGTNTGTAQATVTIADQTAPVVTAPAPIIVPAVDGTGTPATDAAIVAFLAGATALDNVDGDLTGGITHNAPGQFPVGVTTVTFSVTDAAGNPGSAQATVTVTDQGSPIVTAPAPLTVAAVDALGTPATAAAIQTFLTGATAVDAVDGDLTASITHDAPAQFPLGVTTVTFSVTDSGTNTGTAQATVTIADQTAPVVTAPAPIIVPAVDGTGTPATDAAIVAFLAGATALDNVDGDLTGGITHNAPGQFPVGVTTVTFSVTDAAGNPGSAQATVTVTDQGSPIVTAPAPLTVAAVDALGTPATAAAIQTFLTGATAVDAVDGDLTASITHDAPAQFPLGVTTVTFSVTDSGTNTGTAQATVTIADQTAPVVTAPAPIIVPAVDGTGTPATDAAIVAFLAGATALDNVDGDLTGGITHNAPGQFPVGVTTVTFSVTDAAGNPGSAQATVTVDGSRQSDRDGPGASYSSGGGCVRDPGDGCGHSNLPHWRDSGGCSGRRSHGVDYARCACAIPAGGDDGDV